METLYYWRFDSAIGRLAVAVSERGLTHVHFDRGDFPPKKARGVEFVESEAKTRPHVRELREYIAGERKHFTQPLDLRGTEFQKSCWRALLEIPYGETRTYADIARVVGRPKAFRAVGLANNQNPIAIVVPCHRVVGSDGSLVGYGGGLEMKRKLLEMEKALAQQELAF